MKIQSILLISLLFLSIGCRYKFETYTLTNSTGHELLIKGYRTGNNGFASAAIAEEIYLGPHSELFFERSRGETQDDGTYFSVPFVDSVDIVFDSDRVLSIYCSPWVDLNCPPILTTIILKTTITEEDYNNAVPIED